MASPCPACGDHAPGTARRVPDFEYGVSYVGRYVDCRACGSLYQDPMPSPGELLAFYPPEYHSQTGQGPLGRFRHDVRFRRLSRLGREPGPWLDYGCGNGDFLVRAAQLAPEGAYYGFEIGDRPEVARLVDGAVTIVRGDLSLLLETVPSCALISMNHVIEHLPDPLVVLRALRQKLGPSGLLEGQTPAAGSLEHRVFGRRWSGYHAPRHTVVFSPVGLSRLFTRAGFVHVSVRGAFNPAGLAVSVGSLAQGRDGGRVRRGGMAWLGLLAVATLLAPIDAASRAPGIVDFLARKGGEPHAPRGDGRVPT